MTGRRAATFRLAWRLVRRSRGRSLLIALLVAIPVMAGAFAAVTIRTASLSAAEAAARSLGHADAIAQVTSARSLDPALSAVGRDAKGQSQFVDGGDVGHQKGALTWSSLLPPGSRTTPDAWNFAATVTAAGRRTDLSAVVLDLADPMTTGTYDLRRGRFPRSPSEVAVTAALAHRFGLRPGSTLTVRLSGPPLPRTVAGIVRNPFRFDATEVVGAAAALGGLRSLTGKDHVAAWLVDTPGTSPANMHARLADVGVIYATRAQVPPTCMLGSPMSA